jgi:Fe-S cluster assembly protein SufD
MRNMPARRRDAMNADVRAMKTPAEQALSAAYQAARGNLPGMGAVAALRADAFKQFERVGLPHRRVEEWKYTDLRALMREAYPPAARRDASAKANAKAAGNILSGFDCRRLVFVDGAFAPDLSDLKPEPGLTIGSMAEALTKGNALVAQHVGKTFATDDAAVALNTALMGDGVVIRVAADAEIKRPIHLIFASGSDKPSSIFVRSLIVVEKGAKATIIEDRHGAAQVNAALELSPAMKRRSIISVHARPRPAMASLLTSVSARAAFNTFAFTSDVNVVRNQNFIRFAGEGTKAGIRGVTLCAAQHADTTLLIEHAASHCEPEQFKSVLDDQAHGVFRARLSSSRAQKTDAKMMTRSLLLSDEAEADTNRSWKSSPTTWSAAMARRRPRPTSAQVLSDVARHSREGSRGVADPGFHRRDDRGDRA